MAKTTFIDIGPLEIIVLAVVLLGAIALVFVFATRGGRRPNAGD